MENEAFEKWFDAKYPHVKNSPFKGIGIWKKEHEETWNAGRASVDAEKIRAIFCLSCSCYADCPKDACITSGRIIAAVKECME